MEAHGHNSFGGISEQGMADLAVHSIAGAEKYLEWYDSLDARMQHSRDVVPFVISGTTHEERVDSVIRGFYDNAHARVTGQLEKDRAAVE